MRQIALCGVLLAGCAHTVGQDLATGDDGRIKGAKPIKLDNDEGRARGVVTYPGGDRVDWKLIELPTGKRGTLELQMAVRTPRPGLKVAFDVFDQWNAPIATSGTKGRSRATSIDHAAGTYFVRIYAPRRGDAGTYTLLAAFHPDRDDKGPPILDLQIPDPPKLPDASDQSATLAPITPPPLTTPPPVTQPPVTPPVVVAPAAKAVVARVLKVDVEGDGLLITISLGSEAGITKAWHANVLRGETDALLSGGSGSVIRVDKRTSQIRVKLTTNQVGANPNIKLAP